jgi:hypothetical protein
MTMLTKATEKCLHQVGALLRDPEEFERAIQILMAHHPSTAQDRLKRRAEQLARFQAMNATERQEYIDDRIELSHQQREKKHYEELAFQQQLSREIEEMLAAASETYNVRPMFFHYYETKRFVNAITRERYEMKVLRASTCLLIDNDSTDVHSKGIALVSDLDNPSRLAGRHTALSRAHDALIDGYTQDPINRDDAKRIARSLDKEASYMGNWSNKIIYEPDSGQMTNVELDRLDKWRTKRKEAQTA